MGIAAAVGAVALLAISVAFFSSSASESENVPSPDEVAAPTPGDSAPPEDPAPAVPSEIPAALRALASLDASPSAETVAGLFEAVGGLDGLELGTADGPFDLVTFDPHSPDQLLAAHRTGYGQAQNQGRNEAWVVEDGVVFQRPVTLGGRPHDFVHYNPDGTTTVWVHPGGDGFAPRSALTLDRAGEMIAETSEPLYASRFVADGGVVFALTGEPDWYAPQAAPYLALVADDGYTSTVLANGEGFEWVDVPVPGVLVAHPGPDGGETAVWDAGTLEPLPLHPLARKPWTRVAVAADDSVGLAVSTAGELISFEPATGQEVATFGPVDIDAVAQPLTLSSDGMLGFVVEATGVTSIWYVSDAVLATSIEAAASIPRWLPTTRAARVVSVVAPEATRMAVPVEARGQQPTFWRIIDLDLSSWQDRACELAGRDLTPTEATALGMATNSQLCQ